MSWSRIGAGGIDGREGHAADCKRTWNGLSSTGTALEDQVKSSSQLAVDSSPARLAVERELRSRCRAYVSQSPFRLKALDRVVVVPKRLTLSTKLNVSASARKRYLLRPACDHVSLVVEHSRYGRLS